MGCSNNINFQSRVELHCEVVIPDDRSDSQKMGLTWNYHYDTIVLNRTIIKKERRKVHFWDKHKTITSYYELLAREVCERYQLTQMEYDILMFLYSNPQYNTASDIVKVRKSTKSHVSTSIKELENKGMIERIQSAHNKKHIEIVLLDKAEPIVEAGMDAQKQFAKNVLSGLTEEEMQICREIFDKICNNADEYLKNYKRRDDEK